MWYVQCATANTHSVMQLEWHPRVLHAHLPLAAGFGMELPPLRSRASCFSHDYEKSWPLLILLVRNSCAALVGHSSEVSSAVVDCALSLPQQLVALIWILPAVSKLDPELAPLKWNPSL